VTIATLALASSLARADAAGELVKKGIEQFKAGKYSEASDTLKKAYDADGKPETLFALAQAERLAGDCPSAIEHYKEVTAKVSDLNVAKAVEQSLALCPQPEPPKVEHRDDPVAPAVQLPPRVVEKTVVHEVTRTDKLAATFAAVGALSLGGAAGLYIAAEANDSAAQRAYTQPDFTTFEHRFTVERNAAIGAAVGGVALLGVATWRWMRGDRTGGDVVVAPTATGGSVSYVGQW
jgi:tetratricopeptide (TPR) repeat protein